MSVHKGSDLQKDVIPAKAGIQSFQNVLDAPVLSTGQAPQVRHDERRDFMDRLYLMCHPGPCPELDSGLFQDLTQKENARC